MRSRRLIVGAFVALLVAATGAGARGADGPRPNFVFILVDDLRWDALGYAGHPFIKTPHIDRFAREGVNFANAFVSTPLCSPSRASYLTGRYAHAHGIQGNSSEEGGHGLVTFPRLLQGAGYSTAYVGKWHMGDDDSPRPGFDHWVSFKGQGDYHNPGLNIDGTRTKTTGYVTDILSDHAVEFVKRPHHKPFCLYLAHKAVHSSFTPAPRHQGAFADEKIVRAPSAADTLAGKPVLTHKLPVPERDNQNPGTKDSTVLGQLRGVLAIDEGVGQLLEALEKSGRLDDTLVIFTSDNGFFWGEHGRGDKRMAYEESIRVPLVMRYPKLIAAGSTRELLVLNVDIGPTLLDLAGAKIPAAMHGRSLRPVLEDAKTPGRAAILTEYFGNPNNRIPGWQSIRTARWKYVRYTGVEGCDELYDLSNDRYEMNNLITSPDAAARVSELRAELDRQLATTP